MSVSSSDAVQALLIGDIQQIEWGYSVRTTPVDRAGEPGGSSGHGLHRGDQSVESGPVVEHSTGTVDRGRNCERNALR